MMINLNILISWVMIISLLSIMFHTRHLLNILLMVELLILNISLSLIPTVFLTSFMSTILIILILGACGSSLGLCVLVSIIREATSAFSFNWWKF